MTSKDFEHASALPPEVQDWIDGAAAPETEAAARQFLDAHPEQAVDIQALRELAARLRGMGADWRERTREAYPDPAGAADQLVLEARLETLGEAWRAGMPELHLEREIMARLERERERKRPSPAEGRPRLSGVGGHPVSGSGAVPRGGRYPWRERAQWMFRAAAVLAVCGLIGAGWLLMPVPRRQAASVDSGRSRAVFPSVRPHEDHGRPFYPEERSGRRLGDPSRSDLEQKYEALLRPVAPPVPVQVTAAEPDARSARATLALPELLELKRRALARDAAAAARLEAAGSLRADEARRLLHRSDLSLDAFLGAVQFLPPEEAAGYLRQAVEQYPDSPYLRYLLAKNLAMSDATRGEALVHLAALRALDPGNGLPNYLEARERLRDGDLAGALTALDVGADFPQATAFSVETARTRAAALEAAGKPVEEAAFLAASTMGEEAYAELLALSRELLAQARELEAMREYETAQAVADSVMSLGRSLAETSPSANEQLAGADMQMNALDFWVSLAKLLASPEGARSLTSVYQMVASSVESVVSALGLVSSAYESVDPNMAAVMAQQAVREGDLAAAAAVVEAAGTLTEPTVTESMPGISPAPVQPARAISAADQVE